MALGEGVERNIGPVRDDGDGWASKVVVDDRYGPVRLRACYWICVFETVACAVRPRPQ